MSDCFELDQPVNTSLFLSLDAGHCDLVKGNLIFWHVLTCARPQKNQFLAKPGFKLIL